MRFFINPRVDANQGGNQRITLYLQKDVRRVLQSPDAVPADSEAGRNWPKAAAAKNVKFRALSPHHRRGGFQATDASGVSNRAGIAEWTLHCHLPNGTKVEK